MNLYTFITKNSRIHLALLASAAALALPACNPPNSAGTPTNPNDPHDIESMKVEIKDPATDTTVGTAIWSDTDGTGSTAQPNTSLCTLTLVKNKTYNMCISEAGLDQDVENFEISDNSLVKGLRFNPSNNYIAVMGRNEGHYFVYLSDPNGVLASATYSDSLLLAFCQNFPAGFGASGSYVYDKGSAPKSAVGRNMSWKTAATAKTGTVTLTIVRRPDRANLPNGGEAAIAPSSPLSTGAIVDLVVPISVTITN